MSAWGTGILQNDTTTDIWVEFKHLYNQGLDPKEIRQIIEKENKPSKDIEYYSEIWTGIAYGQWMCGELEEYTLTKVKDSIAHDEEYFVLWGEDKKLINKRITAITEFIEKIQIPRAKPLKRKKVIQSPAYFNKGDVISIQLDTNLFIGAIVTQHSDNPTNGDNRIVFTDLFAEKIELEDVLKANILYLDIGGRNNYYRGFFRADFCAKKMAKKIKSTQKIGTLYRDKYLLLSSGIPVGNWNSLNELILEQQDYLKSNPSDKPINVSVKDFLNPNEKLESILIEWDKKIFREKLNKQVQSG